MKWIVTKRSGWNEDVCTKRYIVGREGELRGICECWEEGDAQRIADSLNQCGCGIPAADHDAKLSYCLIAAFNRSMSFMASGAASGSVSVAGRVMIGRCVNEVQVHITSYTSDWFEEDALPEQFDTIPDLTQEVSNG